MLRQSIKNSKSVTFSGQRGRNEGEKRGKSGEKIVIFANSHQ